ncbi:general secretion pathway protein GspK [Kiloniella laminariae]|uniref:general secretion pathway protein GspK n=1 Tax=Kiloniella laminariae TaxID=454162 RepID=UPI000368E9B6|nr:type II secretion system protein GspK [Kiloniella laminariae]
MCPLGQSAALTETASNSNSQRGSALIAALWVSIALSVLISSMIFSARTDIALVRNAKEQARAEAAIDGAINLAITSLPQARNVIGRDGPTVIQNYLIGDLAVEVTISDEGGKIDLNAAPEALLLLFFDRASALTAGDPGEARQLTDALLDWRDTNNIARLMGAEKADYRRADYSYSPRNAPLTNLAELKGLLGMREELYRKIEPLVTLHSQQRGFDPDLAPPELLSVLMGGDFVEDENNDTVLPLALQRFRTRSRRQVFHIETKVSRKKLVSIITVK